MFFFQICVWVVFYVCGFEMDRCPYSSTPWTWYVGVDKYKLLEGSTTLYTTNRYHMTYSCLVNWENLEKSMTQDLNKIIDIVMDICLAAFNTDPKTSPQELFRSNRETVTGDSDTRCEIRRVESNVASCTLTNLTVAVTRMYVTQNWVQKNANSQTTSPHHCLLQV